MGRLKGKIAVITGANSGIGLASAKRFVAEGARVFMTGRRRKELDAAVAEVGHNSRGIEGDVANLADLDRLFAVVKNEAGAIDILFANAGLGEFAALGEITEDHFDRTFGVNVKGTLFTVQKALLASQGWRLDHPGRLDRRVNRHTGLQRLQRQQGGDPQLCPKLGTRPGRPEDSCQRACARRDVHSRVACPHEFRRSTERNDQVRGNDDAIGPARRS
jgi:NAD(P)-dependent dehydrogenase (short-subunit alcohol dehydrogenase family)